MKVDEVSKKSIGMSYMGYIERCDKRTDLSEYITHLTKPTNEEIEKILTEKNLTNEEIIRKINLKAVDRLIKILKEGKIKGSTTKSGFIIGNRKAVCFQDIPAKLIKENIGLETKMMFMNKNKKIRYSGVGLSFDKFYMYMKGARPVIYEEKEYAKKMLGENEYWRIVNLRLNREDPYLENFYLGNREGTIKSHTLHTDIVDWTHECEWRIPDEFTFNLEDEFTLNNHIVLLFKDRECYEYFIKEAKKYEKAQNKLKDEIDESEMYKEQYFKIYISDSEQFDKLSEELGEEIYNEDFLEKLNEAIKEDEQIIGISFDDIKPNIINYGDGNYRIMILDEL